MTHESPTMAVLGLSHRHAYGMTQNLLDAGAVFAGFLDEGDPGVLAGFRKRFPDLTPFSDKRQILEDDAISAVVIVAEPDQRAALAIEAMRHNKDVMVDKPGCINAEELQQIRRAVAETGRIWSVNFSERFEVRAVTKATDLVRRGLIGRVIQTLGIGPHRLNAATRPEFFFDAARYGGILNDIGSHQIDQFLHFTGLNDARISHAMVANYAMPQYPNFEDFGEINIIGEGATGYIRLDWFTPDALPNWGDGRLFILGTEGYIELRKYVDVANRDGTDHLYYCNNEKSEHLHCNDAHLPYFGNFLDDVLKRSETACPQAHTFKVTELALEAQRLGLASRPD